MTEHFYPKPTVPFSPVSYKDSFLELIEERNETFVLKPCSVYAIKRTLCNFLFVYFIFLSNFIYVGNYSIRVKKAKPRNQPSGLFMAADV